MVTPKKKHLIDFKNKHLIDLMIAAGVEWPEDAKYAAQDKDKLCVRFYEKNKPFRSFGMNYWDSIGGSLIRGVMIKLPYLCRNWHQTIVTKEQYAKAVAAIGGNTSQVSESEDVPDSQHAAQLCSGVAGVMPSETIESLLTAIKEKREEHGELVTKADALALEITSIEQQANDKLKEYGFSLYPVAASLKTAQPVITDWRDLQAGDVIECIPYGDERYNTSRWPGGWATSIVGTVHVVKSIDPDSGKISLLDTKDSGYAFRFIYRP